MQIQGPVSVHGAQPINTPHQSNVSQPVAQKPGAAEVDQLDISNEAELASQIRDIPGIRSEKVAQARAAIESGAYETDAKLDVALERLLDEIG